MNTAQLAKYRAEWGKVRRLYRAQGMEAPAADAMRHKLTKKALGVDKSSLDFTNAEFDKVLAVFYAILNPANLDLQIQQLEQSDQRKSAYMEEARQLARRIVEMDGSESRYVDGISMRLFAGRQYHQLDEQQLAKLLGILRRKLNPIPVSAVNKNPF